MIREGEHGEAPPAPEGLDPRLYELYAELWEMPESVLWRPEEANAVLLAREVAVALEQLSAATERGDTALVFGQPSTGDTLHAAGLGRRFRRALEDVGLQPHRFHDLRHTFGTTMAAAGVPMRTLQEWMGHRDFATTQRYADYAPGLEDAGLVEAAFAARGPVVVPKSPNLTAPQST